MKTCTWIMRLAALAGMAVATTALAQKEQWLDYHVNRQGMGYRYLNVTTNPPAKVGLPKLNEGAYFAQWTTPLDPAGRWVCVDRTKRSGLYDRVYVDSNGNGRLDDETAVVTSHRDDYSATFEPAKVVFKGEDGPLAYHIVVRFMQYGEGQVNCYASSGGHYAGKVDIGGKKRQVRLLDSNVNGTFNDQGGDMSDSDSVEVEGDKGGVRHLGKLLEVDGALYRIEVARDGAFLKLEQAQNVALGPVRVPESITEFIAYGEMGHFVRKPAKGEFTLPAGKYRIEQWKINRKDDKGAAWELMAYNFPESARFAVAAAKAATLEIGEPMRAVMEAEPPPVRPGAKATSPAVQFSLRFEGRYGETLQIMKGNQRPAGPRLTLASPDGSYQQKYTFEFG